MSVLEQPDKFSEFSEHLLHRLPYAVFVLMPVFAALCALVYRGRRQTYGMHLLFTVHLHAFIFAVFLLCLLPGAHAFSGLRGARDSGVSDRGIKTCLRRALVAANRPWGAVLGACLRGDQQSRAGCRHDSVKRHSHATDLMIRLNSMTTNRTRRPKYFRYAYGHCDCFHFEDANCYGSHASRGTARVTQLAEALREFAQAPCRNPL